MSTTLYRKYRPQEFSFVKGQEEIIQTLTSQIQHKQFGHAYLFSGGRGTGKTTVARIFAKDIGVASEDLYELDAASNRTIDDIRDLREAVKTLPFSSPYKCYIIDEVHMLTKEAFNALLKTLEEPPKHVIFILATTNDEKVPDTIISRCQTFRFKSPSVSTLVSHISDITKREGYSMDKSSLDLVALAGDGSFRDALSVLEKIFSRSHQQSKIDVDLVANIIGAPRLYLLQQVIEGISKKDAAQSLGALLRANEEHVDMQFFYKLLLVRIRAVLLLRYAPEYDEIFEKEFSPEESTYIRDLSRQPQPTIHSHTLLELLAVSQHMKYSIIPALPLELAIIKLTT